MERTTAKDIPEAKYTKIGEKIRHVIPGPMQCSMACGGRNCKWENPSRWSDQDQVIKGVFSSWVLDDVVAMSRPSTEVIQKYELIKQFKENKICSIINLQRPGEHASCGPPLHKESQFTYEPQIFMENDIFFYNFGWKDYGVTSLETILDMVKVMAFALSEGKVAVHCHAGLGRTGVLISCFLVYAHRMDASSAINTIRKRRPNSIQTRGQIACIQEFAQFLKPLRIVFPQVVPHAERLTLAQFLHRQRHLLHGFESRELRYIPKLVSVVCQRLVEIATTSQDIGLYDTRTRANTGPKSKSAKRKKGALRRSNTIETLKETLPGAFVNEHLDSNESYIDPMESQKMNALLSPRVSRKSESAKSKSSSGSKSQSRPESPVSPMFGPEALNSPDKQKFHMPSNTSEPILVASVSSQPIFGDTPQEQTAVDKIPGKPKVVLVKQGSRSKLSSAANVMQSQDINLNNNNQIMSSPILPPQVPPVELPNSIDRNVKEQDDADVEIITHLPKLPSPTLSLHEPEISPRGQSKSKETGEQNAAAGDKPPVQNVRSATGKQQRVIPTGMPAPSRKGSAKGLKLSLQIGDSSNVKVEDAGSSENSGDFQGKETETQKSEKGESAGTDDVVVGQTENLDEENKPPLKDEPDIVNQSKKDNSSGNFLDESLDDELDEIIQMKDDGGHFLSESDSENEDAKSPDLLSKSTASKVSWLEKKSTEENEEDPLQKDDFTRRAVSADGRRTPLMYRAGNTHDLLTEQDANNIEQNSEESLEDEDKNASENDQLPDLSPKQDSKTSPGQQKRPKSAGFLKRMAEKNQSAVKKTQLLTLNLTQSLCDLRKYDEISRDDLALMKTEMTPDLFLPLSPSSKSSSSDDVRTPTGSASKRRIKDPITVAMALAYKLTDNEWLWEKVYTKQVEVNTREGAWSLVEQEVDAHLLSCLMWSWIEHLSEPVISPENVEMLVKESRPEHEKSTSATECPEPDLFDKALIKLGKPISSTFQCILHCLLSLPPLSFELEASVIKRVTSALTQWNMQDDSSHENSEYRKKHEQLVSLTQNYLVKTRARISKKQSSTEEKSSKDSEATKKKQLQLTDTDDTKNQDAPKKEYPKGEGDNVPSASKVSELRLRIAVS